MNLTRDEKQAIFEELLDGLRVKRREDFPPNITAGEYAEREGLGRRTAYERLEAAVEHGLLQKERSVNIEGRSCCIYFAKEQAPTE